MLRNSLTAIGDDRTVMNTVANHRAVMGRSIVCCPFDSVHTPKTMRVVDLYRVPMCSQHEGAQKRLLKGKIN